MLSNEDQKREYNKLWKSKNKDKVSEQGKRYYQRHREKILARSEAYREANKKKITERNKRYYDKNREQVRKRYAEYRSENRGSINKAASAIKRTRDGKIKSMYTNMKARFKDKRLPYINTLCTWDEFTTFVKTTNYNELFKAWTLSNYEFKLTPSIDRIDCDGGYSLDNIQIITLSDNCKKMHLEKGHAKPVILFNDKEKLVFNSMAEAEMELGLYRGSIAISYKSGHKTCGYQVRFWVEE